jgi:hypothetical protein
MQIGCSVLGLGSIWCYRRGGTWRVIGVLQSVTVNHERLTVKEGDEFILSCVAQGSSYMTFRWYKDGAFVNKNKTLR